MKYIKAIIQVAIIASIGWLYYKQGQVVALLDGHNKAINHNAVILNNAVKSLEAKK